MNKCSSLVRIKSWSELTAKMLQAIHKACVSDGFEHHGFLGYDAVYFRRHIPAPLKLDLASKRTRMSVSHAHKGQRLTMLNQVERRPT